MPTSNNQGVAGTPCQQSEPDLWFSESPPDIRRAKARCHPCPIRTACFAGALRRREPFGVWGGELFVRGAVVVGSGVNAAKVKDDLLRLIVDLAGQAQSIQLSPDRLRNQLAKRIQRRLLPRTLNRAIDGLVDAGYLTVDDSTFTITGQGLAACAA